MSNLSGNVDVVREQERRARLQLLDDIREPSPQPIFKEPVKVELEDETSRRIKNTLGDFTQVPINDTKALLGISRTSFIVSSHRNHHSASKKQPFTSHSSKGIHKHVKNQPFDTSFHPLSSRSTDPYLKGLNSITCNAISEQNSNNVSPPNKYNFQSKLPQKKPEKLKASPTELETILREMKQAIPPPLTAIQTPRTGDAFDDLKEVIAFKSTSEYPNNLSSNSSTAANMEAVTTVPSNSSSSESGDSDSEDSSSESNESDSSASSDASDEDTPSKMWGLSNFFDESRRNRSPAFVPMDTSTNSSTIAVKEEPVVAPFHRKQTYSLADEESVHEILQKPITECVSNFLELDTPVNIKSEILSPITSPLHSSSHTLPVIRGPRTPPSPVYEHASKEENDENCALLDNRSAKTSVVPEIEQHSEVQQNNCKINETSKGQATIEKKMHLSKSKSKPFSPRTNSSPVIQSFVVDDDEISASKGLFDTLSDKDESETVANTLSTLTALPSEASESIHENYPVKTHQNSVKSSNIKRTKNNDHNTESDQTKKRELKSTLPAKLKHSSRTSKSSKDSKHCLKAVRKSSDSRETKTLSKCDLKDKNSSERKLSLKSSSNNKCSKSSIKVKRKLGKKQSKEVSESKKGENKKKRSKFHIENFLQSPTISQSESSPIKITSIHSPSHDDLQSPAEEHSSSTPSSPCTPISKKVEKNNSNKLRRSTRCSERSSSSSQLESSSVENYTKKCINRTPKQKQSAKASPAFIETPPSLLSPIPQYSPGHKSLSEYIIPVKIMVCIPLEKLTRLPFATNSVESKSKSDYKNKPNDNISTQKNNTLNEKLKNTSSKASSSKCNKEKSRTNVDSENNKSKLVTHSKKEKSNDSLSSKSKTMSNVNNQVSIKSDEKSNCDENQKSIKKRKSQDDKQHLRKKAKTYLDVVQKEIKLTSHKPESPIESPSKSKPLEKCDNTSNHSWSSRSSKEKEVPISTCSGKREKNYVSGNFVKQEKIKTVIKKEPKSPERSKENSRDHLVSIDSECKQKPSIGSLINDQYFHWTDHLKEDSKSLINEPSLLDSLHRVCGFDWHDFGPEITKDLKEAANLTKHNPPIMPMDYYYTEGRKQRHLAEKEKDPILQTLKYFEATVLFILTSQQREECAKELESVYQSYRDTLNFSNLIVRNVRGQYSSPGTIEFKLLILILRCQALLHVKLYNLKIKEIKEQAKSVSDFFLMHTSATVKSSHLNTNARLNLTNIPSPHSPTTSPASSVNSQTSGYCNSDVSGNPVRNALISQSVNVAPSMLEMIYRQHTHLMNLHLGHDLWEQADMYMTRSNLREFFKEIADQSEALTLHSSIKDLVNYLQTGISLVKKYCR